MIIILSIMDSIIVQIKLSFGAIIFPTITMMFQLHVICTKVLGSFVAFFLVPCFLSILFTYLFIF